MISFGGTPFERERRNIQPDSHIDPFLPEGRHEVVVGEVLGRKAPIQKLFLRVRI